MRKFEILDVELSPGGPGPERAWRVHYKAIVSKKWVEDQLWILACTAEQARAKAMERFGGKL